MMWLIHIVAFIFFFPALLITIPLHIMINNQKKAAAPPE